MPHKPSAVIAAMPIELAPLIGNLASRQVNGVDLFDLPNALVAVGGIGEKFARRAAEIAIQDAHPNRLISAGVVGAISPMLKVGDVGRIREVVDVATGTRYPCCSGGNWVLATSREVSDASEKQELRTKYGAEVVDMEGAAVARSRRNTAWSSLPSSRSPTTQASTCRRWAASSTRMAASQRPSF